MTEGERDGQAPGNGLTGQDLTPGPSPDPVAVIAAMEPDARRIAPGPLSPMETVTPAVTPTVDQQALFRPMLQGTGTNRLTRLSTRKTPPAVDRVTGLATIYDESLTVFIERYDSLAGGLRVSTHKLLDAFTIALTAKNNYRGTGEPDTLVTISLDDYMLQCGIPLTKASKDKMRRKVREDLEALYNTSMEWTEPAPARRGKAGITAPRDYAKMRVISYQSIRNSQITVRFSPEIALYLTHAYIMQYPVKLFRVDERNPSAYYIGKKLLLHHSMYNNKRRGTANIISVKALLACAPDIPTYEEVSQRGRQLDQRIIAPFENALSALSDTITWAYCNAKGAPLTEEQIERFTYTVFIASYIHFEVLNAPDTGK